MNHHQESSRSTLFATGNRFFREGFPHEAVAWYRESLKNTGRNDYISRGKAYFNIGSSYLALSQWPTAAEYYAKSAAEFLKAGDFVRVACALAKLGVVYSQMGRQYLSDLYIDVAWGIIDGVRSHNPNAPTVAELAERVLEE